MVKVATQGRKDYRQWVTQYYLSFSQDGIHFAEYKQNSNRKVRESRLMFHVDSELRFFFIKRISIVLLFTEQQKGNVC